jgi:hypothetical protein
VRRYDCRSQIIFRVNELSNFIKNLFFKKEQTILDFRHIVMCSYHGKNIVECSISVEDN